MSLSSVAKVSCPKCGKQADFGIWKSVNTNLNPELVEQIENTSIFDFTCPSCGTVTKVAYPMLLNDMEHKMMIWYSPNRDEDVMKEMDTQAKMMSGMGIKFRITYNPFEFAQKVRISRYGLDDRAIELLKYLTVKRSQHNPEDFGFIDFIKDDDVYQMIFFGENPMMGAATAEDIRRVEAEFSQYYSIGEFTEYEVDQSWAANFFAMLDDSKQV